MFRLLMCFITALTSALALQGCMALAIAPFVAGMADKPANFEYQSTAKKAALFNASLRTLTARGADGISSDRETGTLRGSISVSGGQAAYELAISIDELSSGSKIRVSGKSASVFKMDLSTSTKFVEGFVADLETNLGSKLRPN